MRSPYELIFFWCLISARTLCLVPRFRPLRELAEQIGENVGRQNMRIDPILDHPFSFFCQGKHQLSQGSPRILVALHILVLHELPYRRRGKPQVACQNLS
jgi:hypothetical protein